MRNLLTKPTTTKEYLALLPEGQRAALERLREQILNAARDAEEHFGYGLPGFKYNDHPMLYLGAAKKHLALYGAVPAGFKDRLKDFTVSKGTIQFTPEKPLPPALVKKLVQARAVENASKKPALSKKKPAARSRNIVRLAKL